MPCIPDPDFIRQISLFYIKKCIHFPVDLCFLNKILVEKIKLAKQKRGGGDYPFYYDTRKSLGEGK